MADHDPHPDLVGIEIMLDELAAGDQEQSNCMFQLAIMLARIAIEPCGDRYRDDAAQAMLALIRQKPKTSVVNLFGAGRLPQPTVSRAFATA